MELLRHGLLTLIVLSCLTITTTMWLGYKAHVLAEKRGEQ